MPAPSPIQSGNFPGFIAPQEVFLRLGGEEGGAVDAFAALVDAFYIGVEADPLLRPMYPSDPESLAEARENLALFLIQYFGGPPLYARKRGHPRLRMRHAPFAVGPAARDAWLRHMEAALHAVPALEPVAPTLRAYFVHTAHFLQNQETDPPEKDEARAPESGHKS